MDILLTEDLPKVYRCFIQVLACTGARYNDGGMAETDICEQKLGCRVNRKETLRNRDQCRSRHQTKGELAASVIAITRQWNLPARNEAYKLTFETLQDLINNIQERLKQQPITLLCPVITEF